MKDLLQNASTATLRFKRMLRKENPPVRFYLSCHIKLFGDMMLPYSQANGGPFAAPNVSKRTITKHYEYKQKVKAAPRYHRVAHEKITTTPQQENPTDSAKTEQIRVQNER